VIQIKARLDAMGSIAFWLPDAGAPKGQEAMPDIRVSEALWSTGMLPEGILERWLVEDGARVREGEAVAAVRIGEALHDIVSSADGQVSIMAPAGDLVDPGCVIAEVDAR
jgi:acetyl/propionyl-CoA carboxylase alpha subunit